MVEYSVAPPTYLDKDILTYTYVETVTRVTSTRFIVTFEFQMRNKVTKHTRTIFNLYNSIQRLSLIRGNRLFLVTNLTFTLSDTKLPVNAALNASIMSHKGYGMQYEFVFNPAKKPSTSYTTNNNQDTVTFPGYARPGIYEVYLTGWNAVDRLTVRKNVSVFYELLNIVS